MKIDTYSFISFIILWGIPTFIVVRGYLKMNSDDKKLAINDFRSHRFIFTTGLIVIGALFIHLGLLFTLSIIKLIGFVFFALGGILLAINKWNKSKIKSVLVKKIFKYTIIGIATFLLILLGFYYLIIRSWQGEFFQYDNGVTIEVYNSSKQEITDLNFYFSFYKTHVHQNLGNINKLEPGETTILYSHQIKDVGNDRSLYLQYPLNKNKTDVVSLAYVPSYKPSKIVVVLEITGTDNYGKHLFRLKGFDDIGQFEVDLTSARE
ncbi:hypothetical protein [Psychrobacillus sp. FJAT-21963]|uniref:hypothetical protein n=1 Tax=Psychrobacillus sp. FJAT-21963 TaxID=1712028 RepID=UPI001C0F8846|nr:hypothetical protein [Psychrobacillus sp. FJAT-21963]